MFMIKVLLLMAVAILPAVFSGGNLIIGFSGFALLIYFLPTIVAYGRRHRQKFAILILNIVAGWTFLGWVVALVWASTQDVE